MAKISILPSSRVTYDPDNQAIRSYFEPRLHDETNDAPTEDVTDEFIHDNQDVLKFDPKNLMKLEIKNTSGFQSVRYLQIFKNIPVYSALLTVNVGTKDGNILSFYNNYDYGIPADFDISPSKTMKEAYEVINRKLTMVFTNIKINGETKLYIYRHKILPWEANDLATNPDDGAIGKRSNEQIKRILKTIPSKIPKDKELFLVWQFIVDIFEPFFTSLEVLVDSHSGDIILARDRSNYVNGTGKVFVPDPVTASGTSLCTTPGSLSPAIALDLLQQNVTLQGLDPADTNGKYHLIGTYCRIRDDEPPYFSPPEENSPDFNYSVTNRHFLAVMIYYWIDTVQRYIQNDLAVPDAADYQIPVDAQGRNGADDSKFFYIAYGKGRLTFGVGGAPDASDASGVIVHEYGHAIHADQGFTGADDLQEGFGDILACLYRDRYNPTLYRREQVFPFDNNPDCSYTWSSDRRTNLTQAYSDPNYSTYYHYLKGDIWASTVWQIYLALGGASAYETKRRWAADICIKLHLMANVGYGLITTGYMGSFSTHQIMGEAFEMASHVLNNWMSIPNGLFHKVIRDRYTNKGLFPPLNVDIYIDDGRNGGYDYNESFWNCQDIVVRRSSSDNPTMGHEEPIINQRNYAWIKVKRRGAGNPGTVNVKAFDCNPGTGLIWPSHWTAMSPPSLPANTLNSAAEEWVGPFTFTPTVVGHECLLAIVEAQNDNANTQSLIGSVPHWMLVPFDNNIGQRNISTVSGGGGSPIRAFRIINSSKNIISVSLDVKANLPKGWILDFDVPDIKKIPLRPYEERWVKLRVRIPIEEEIRESSQSVRVVITSLVDGIPDGGMTFDFVHPSTLPSDAIKDQSPQDK